MPHLFLGGLSPLPRILTVLMIQRLMPTTDQTQPDRDLSDDLFLLCVVNKTGPVVQGPVGEGQVLE